MKRTREIGRRIRERREKLGWTQDQLASRINVQQARISQIESGDVSTLAVLGRVADAMQIQITDLM